MGKNTLCIDLSDGRIGLLLLNRTGRRLAAAGHVVEMRPPSAAPDGPTPDEMARAVADAVAREGLEFDDCVLVLDSADALYRDFVLPFSAISQLERTMAYELEEDLPLGVADLVFDFTRIRLQGRSSRVCAAAYGRRPVVELLEALAAVGLDPSPVGPEVVALAAAVTLGRKHFPDKALLVDLGRTRTVLTFLQQGTMAAVRVLDQGEDRLLASASASTGGGLSEDALRRALAFADLSAPAPEGSEAEAVKRGMDDMLRGVARYTALFEETVEPWPGPVFFCGELASTRGLRELLMARMEREAFALAESRDVRAVFGMSEAVDLGALAACLGAGLPGPPASRMNLRRGDLARVERRRPIRRALTHAAVLAGLVLLCWGLLAGMRLHRQAQALASYRSAMDQIFVQALPEVQGDFNRSQQVSILKNRIARLRDAATTDTGGSRSFLQDLQAIHAAVGQDLDVVIDRLSSDPRRMSTGGTVGDFRMVEGLRNALASSGRFPQVEIKGASTDKDSGRVRFEMELARQGS